jgi:hypothetical protein
MLSVNLVNEENPSFLTAFVSDTSIHGTRADKQFNAEKSATFDNVNVDSYVIYIINENNQVITIDIENPEQCDNLIASNNDNEICRVSIEADINDALSKPIEGGSLDIKIGSSREAFKTAKTDAELVSEDEKNDPPFRACEAFEITDHLSTPVTKFIRSPSSAQYLIKTSLSGEELENLIKKNRDSDVTFTIINDLYQIDNISVSNEINSKYLGQIAFYNKDGTKRDILNFMIDSIDTECRYVSLIQPIQKLNASQEFQWTPFTEEGKFKFKKHKLPNFNYFPNVDAPFSSSLQLMDREPAVKLPNRNEPLSVLKLNPPFGSCVGVASSLGHKDSTKDDKAEPSKSEIISAERDNVQFAEYVMFGSLNGKISGTNTNSDEGLVIKLTTEQNLLAADSAKITGKENSYAKLDLFFNPEQYPEEKINFHLKGLSYNCHGVGFVR